MFKLTKKKVAAGLVAAGLIASTGVAFAYWTANGSGSGSASTGASVDVTLTGDAVGPLYPGADASDITGTVDVSNGASSAYVASITPSIKEGAGGTVWQDVDGPDTDGTDSPAGDIPPCSAADYDLHSATIGHKVTSGATGVAFGTIQLKDTSANQDSCKGQALVLSFSSN